jgi:hypothetical protein
MPVRLRPREATMNQLQQMLAQALGLDPAVLPGDPVADPRAAKLDRVAITLIGAVAAVGGALAVFGVSSDRISLLLDDERAGNLLIGAGVLAVLAVGLSLLALFITSPGWETGLLGGGAAAYIAGLLCAIFAASVPADYSGHPAISRVDLVPGSPSTLTMTVRAGSLDEDQSVKVQVDNASLEDLQVDPEAGGDPVYSGTMRPDSLGRVEQEVSLPIPEKVDEMVLRAWRLDESSDAPSCEVDTFDTEVVCLSFSN